MKTRGWAGVSYLVGSFFEEIGPEPKARDKCVKWVPDIRIYQQNVKVKNADGKNVGGKQKLKEKGRLGHNVEWKQRQLGQSVEEKKR
jgi:hypothetical protein